MASSTILTTAFSEGVVFDDFVTINERLLPLMEDFEEFEDGEPIIDFRDGKLLFRGFEEHEPVAESEVWTSWTLKVSRLVAQHLLAGRLVLKLSHEFGKQEYHILTPGQVTIGTEDGIWARA